MQTNNGAWYCLLVEMHTWLAVRGPLLVRSPARCQAVERRVVEGGGGGGVLVLLGRVVHDVGGASQTEVESESASARVVPGCVRVW